MFPTLNFLISKNLLSNICIARSLARKKEEEKGHTIYELALSEDAKNLGTETFVSQTHSHQSTLYIIMM
jgi:hypothetical protein